MALQQKFSVILFSCITETKLLIALSRADASSALSWRWQRARCLRQTVANKIVVYGRIDAHAKNGPLRKLDMRCGGSIMIESTGPPAPLLFRTIFSGQKYFLLLLAFIDRTVVLIALILYLAKCCHTGKLQY